MKKRTMEKENQAEERRKKILMEIAGTVVVLTVIVSIGLFFMLCILSFIKI